MMKEIKLCDGESVILDLGFKKIILALDNDTLKFFNPLKEDEQQTGQH